MGKAVIVLDKVPKCCLGCPCSNLDIEPTITCYATDKATHISVALYGRPESCPIKELPEAKEIPFDDGWYQRGWNDCLGEIIGVENLYE